MRAIAILIVSLCPLSAMAQGPPPVPLFPFMVPSTVRDMYTQWFAPVGSGAIMHTAEFSYNLNGAPNPNPPHTYYWGLITYVVWTSEYEAQIRAAGSKVDYNRYRWKGTAVGAGSNAGFTSDYRGASFTGRKSFNVNGVTVVGFECQPRIVHNYSIKDATVEWGIYKQYLPGDETKPHPRVQYYIVESFAIPPDEIENVSQMVILGLPLDDPDRTIYLPSARDFEDVARSDDGTLGRKNAIENAFGEDEWAKKLGYEDYLSAEPAAPNWSVDIPIIGSTPVTVSLDPGQLSSTIGSLPVGQSMRDYRDGLRAFLLFMLYYFACKRVVALLMEDKYVALAAEAYEDDEEEDE